MFETNEYFDGKVKSIAFKGESKPATVGVMAAGNYVFNTTEKERMTVVSGEMSVKFSGETETQNYQAGQSFEVTANNAFDVSVASVCAYLCEYG